MNKDNHSRPEERLAALLRMGYDAMQRDVYGGLERAGYSDIRTSHSSVLRYIDADGTRAVILADRAGMTKQSMAYLVNDLEQSGYVELVPDPDDGRAKLVRPTAKGRELLARLRALSKKAEQNLADHVGRDRLDELKQTLRTLFSQNGKG